MMMIIIMMIMIVLIIVLGNYFVTRFALSASADGEHWEDSLFLSYEAKLCYIYIYIYAYTYIHIYI